MTQRTCVDCGKTLEHDPYLDLYIPERQERCEDCWYEYEEQLNGFSVYGLAPHSHDFSKTGSYLGSTVMADYKATSKQDERGRYWIEDRQMWFTPDEEVEGHMGLWEER